MSADGGTSRGVVVVGAGILGLAAAEAFSRSGVSVTVCRSPVWPAASAAAAANLATKAQRFGRDPHYALKLEAKENYERWLARAGVDARVFRRGVGLDFFANEQDAEAHFFRVMQPADEIAARGLAPQETVRAAANVVRHEDEATVDAPALLEALEATCRSRGVIFVERTVATHADLFEICADPSVIVLCTGAGTSELLASLGLVPQEDTGASLARRRLASVRFTVGSTFRATSHFAETSADAVSPVDLVSLLPVSHRLAKSGGDVPCEAKGAALVDFSRGRHTVTLSAQGGMLNVSSSSVRVASAREFKCEERARWQAEDQAIVSLLPPGTVERVGLEARAGVRVGFGAGELLVCELEAPWQKTRAPKASQDSQIRQDANNRQEAKRDPRVFLCAGAHKSGFLFAPAVEQLLQGVGAL